MDEVAALEHRRRVVWLSMIPQAVAIAVLLGLAAGGVPAIGFLGAALLVPLIFTPKVARDLSAVVRVVRTGSTPVAVEVRSEPNPMFRRMRNVWADIYPRHGDGPLATVPVGAVLSGVPSKERALLLHGRVDAEALGVAAPGQLVVLRTPEGLVLPSGPARVPSAR